jgi:hypothetical protein|tara:strand:+ start:7567 stop:7923 length:357 start_codon:yes stop_codon:yes gene_type:complete
MFVVAILGTLFFVNLVAAEKILHLKLDSSIPKTDEILKASPKKIVLEFSQRPELSIAKIDIQDGKLGKVMRSEEDETILWAAIEESLPAGKHTVKWVTSSSDGHPVRGEFSFAVSARR